ncbi:hypothetical protein BJ165DRAFT_1610536 [Panaeolus papilionaceus]|nr:hypothetical protein BJ165DRAFT_1610536 [Panaeolus papilionaceus]
MSIINITSINCVPNSPSKARHKYHTMQLKLATIISSITLIASAASLVGAVALPEAEADKRQIICTGIPLGGICTSGNQCCGFPTNGCFGPPGGTRRCQVAGG